MSDSLPPHGLQHTRLPCPSLSPGVCSSARSYPPSPLIRARVQEPASGVNRSPPHSSKPKGRDRASCRQGDRFCLPWPIILFHLWPIILFLSSRWTGPWTLPKMHVQLNESHLRGLWVCIHTYYGLGSPPFLTLKKPSCTCADREVFFDFRRGHFVSLL